MTKEQLPSAGQPALPGITRLTTEHGSKILVAWELRAYKRTPGHLSRQLPGDDEWLQFTEIGPIQIAERAKMMSTDRSAGSYISSPIVAIEQVAPARELSAAEIETVRLVGGYINGWFAP